MYTIQSPPSPHLTNLAPYNNYASCLYTSITILYDLRQYENFNALSRHRPMTLHKNSHDGMQLHVAKHHTTGQ